MTKIMPLFKFLLLILPVMVLTACSTNQATGRNQFTGLMSADSEAKIGAEEHQKILAQFGGAVEDAKLRNYVTKIGQKIVPHTERKDVTYTFTLLDSPVVNAFALPGGYVYVTRGILTLANSEAELAAVIAHEIGHVTARHSAERYSTSVLTGLGATILSAAINVQGASQALNLGANLYLSSYSRSQEHEADDLGVRYLSRAKYDPTAMAGFLRSLEASSALEALETGRNTKTPSYLSTHPVTAERVTRSAQAAASYPQQAALDNRLTYMKMINGMTIGDSAKQGFETNGKFVHPDLGFMLDLPQGFTVQNSAQAVLIGGKNAQDGTILLTSGKKTPDQSIEDYLRQVVLKGDMSGARDFGTNRVNGFSTASVETTGTVNNRRATLRTIVFEWDRTQVYQLTLVMPNGIQAAEIENLRESAFSFRRMTTADKTRYQPKHLSFRVGKAGDTVESLSRHFPYDDPLNAQRFRVLNALGPNDPIRIGQAYKVIVQ